jgi:sugar phosphate isomerase/epimerase
MLKRREFLSSAIVATGMAALGPGAKAQGLDPASPDIRFGTTGSIFGVWRDGAMRTSTDMRLMMRDVKHYGLEGLEPYSGQVQQYMDNPAVVKKLSAETGVTLVDVGDLPRRTGSAPWKGNPWLGGEDTPKLVAEMESFARTFLQPMGCTHWKNNMGARPEGGPSDDQLKRLAQTSNEIGRKTLAYGVRLALHPHIWGPMEREHEFRRVMELTDPRYVFLILDTGHNVLGGMDVVKITAEFLPRIAEFHLKDTFPQYRGNKQTPTREQHSKKSVYASVGQGKGVDFPGVFKVMRDRKWKGWAVFDIDAPRPGDGTGTVDDNIAASVNYMRTALGVKLPPANGKAGLFKEA